MNESKFNMWRAIAGMARIDGKVTSEEEEFLKETISKLPIDESKKKILVADIENGVDLNELYSKITHKPDRAMLLHYARIIFYRDEEYSKEEKWCFDSLNETIMKDINLPEIVRDTGHAVDELEKSREAGSIGFKLLTKYFRG